MKIRNWTKFQHYKGRRPPWIKVYRELLDDPDWIGQSDPAKALLIELWMIASETDEGTLPDLKTLAWRLRRASNVLAETLLVVNTKFLEGASEMLATCLQGASPEKSRDRVETETEYIASPAVVVKESVDGKVSLGEERELDQIDVELGEEEKRFLKLAYEIREKGENLQKVIDGLPRPSTRQAYDASRMLANGVSGLPRTRSGVLVLRLTCDALEARQRAQDAPILSDNNRRTFDAADRVLARMVAKRDGKPIPREIEG